jgi:hypothetical protein
MHQVNYSCSVANVGRTVNGLGKGRDFDLEPLLDIFEHLRVVFVAYEGNSETLCAESSSSSNSVKVAV